MAWEEMEAAIRSIVELQRLNTETLGTLLQTSQESQRRLDAAIERYVDAADARMKQMEQNLDALIRIITAEHSNGKGRP